MAEVAETDQSEEAFKGVIKEILGTVTEDTLNGFAGTLDEMALEVTARAGQTNSPGLELYWEGFADGLVEGGTMAREIAKRLHG